MRNKRLLFCFVLIFNVFIISITWSQKYISKIDELSDEVEDKVIKLRHNFHQHPELSNREFNTSKIVADYLNALGFDKVYTHVGKTGVVGVLNGGKPGDKVIALRADMDALPIKEMNEIAFKSNVVDEDYPGGPFFVSHACGHDTHVAMLLGVAEVLAKMKDDIPGTVKLIFQPAEEGPPIEEIGGASLMVKEGVLENPIPDMVYTIHVGPYPNHTILYTSGTAMASSFFLLITINGKGTHGSSPWTGKDPMPVAAEIVSALAQVYRQVPATEPFTITIGKIEDEGRFNTIGNKVHMVGTVRIISDNIIDDVKLRIDRIAMNIAEAHGLTANVEWLQHVPALKNNPDWLQRILPTVERVVGKDNIHLLPKTLGYDDVSEFINPIGGAYMFLGGQDVTISNSGFVATKDGKGRFTNHSPYFYVNDEVLKTGVKLQVNVVMDFLTGGL